MRKLIRNRAIWLLVASFTILVTCFAQQPGNTGENAAAQNAAPAENTGEQTVSFTGYVRTSAGTGIPGASVRITNTDIKKSWATWTDAQGRFSLPALPPGHYHIEATQLGFATNTNDFTLSGYNEKPSLITLNVATLAQLNAPAQKGGAANANASEANNPAANGNGGGRGGFGNGGSRGGFGRGGNGTSNGRAYGRGQGRGAQGQGTANANNQAGQNGQNAGQSSTFAQTDLTGITNSDDQTQQIGSGDQFGADASLGANLNGNTADATVLQGGVAQGQSFGGPGGFPGGPGGFGPGGPGGIGGDINFGTPGDAGAFTGAGGAPVGAGFAGGPGTGGGPGGGGFGGRGGGGGAGGGGFGGRGGRGGGAGGLFAGGRGGRGAGAGRLFRQRANRYRYAFYDTYNNSALNARPFSFNTTEVPKVATYNENFGGDLQGPFKIPHLYDGTGRTNVFLNYEHRTNESAANNYSIVPTAAERAGDFCGPIGSTGFFNPYNPSGPTLPCNLALATNPQTGSGAFVPNAAAVGLLNPSYIPLPNFAGQTTQGYNYLLQLRTPANTDIVNARIMHTINSKFNLTGVYAANIARSKSIGSFPDTIGNTSTLGQSITLTLNHNWSARTVERTNASWSRSRSQLSSLTQYGADVESELGIQGASPLPVNFGLPQISFQSAGTLSQPVPSLTRNQTLLLGDTVSFYKTKHTFIIGGQVRDIDLNNNASPNPRGTFAFNGDFTCGSAFADGTSGTVNGVAPCTGTKTSPVQLTPQQTVAYEMADFLIGLPYTAAAQYGTPQNIYLRSWGFAAYAQDDFRVTKTFTVQYGLRWDATKPTVEKYNHIANLVPTFGANGVLTNVTVVTPGIDGFPRALVNGAYKNFGPRTGFAWILPEKKKRTVVRGGYSVFYNVNTFTSLVRDFSFQPPFDTSFTLQNSSSNFFTIQNGLTAPSTSAVT
ncbi:MAG TPA: carboxypeptidase-like regulatory domain-containing protein, partial [Candidatus Acidoferrales bacterium]